MPVAYQSREVTEPQRDLSAKLTEGVLPRRSARFNVACSKINVPARADVGIRPYGEERRQSQGFGCLHRGVEGTFASAASGG